jgi:hypothetical protein
MPPILPGFAMRLARPTILFLLILAGAPAAWADGFSRFQDLLLSRGKADMIRFASGSSLGPDGFVLENVVVTPPPELVEPGKIPVKPMPTRIARITVEAIDFDSIARDKPPLFVRARLEGIALDGKAAPDGAMRKYLGADLAMADLSIAYRLDAAGRVFELTQLEINLRGLTRLVLALTIDGVTPDAIDAPSNAGAASLRSASLTIDDASLMARLIRALAEDEGVSPEQQADTLVRTVLMMVGGDGPVTQAAAQTVAAFLRDWQRPRGPLSITLRPGGGVTFAELGAITKAEDAMKALGLVVTYAGAAAAPQPPSPANAALIGRAAIDRLIGNTTTATIDGQDVVDYFAPDGTYVSQVDAVVARGRWRISDQQQLCLKLPDDDENCFNVAVAGRKVTYLYDVDDEEELELHEGNPRNL